MTFTIYKPGQGYWTRLITGLAGGVLILAGAWWLWDVLESYQIPNGLYIQAAAAVSIIAVFGLLLFRWVAVKPGSVDFLIATEGEMKKVNWPTRREVLGSTWIVIVFLAILSGILFGSDWLFFKFFSLIGVLDVATTPTPGI